MGGRDGASRGLLADHLPLQPAIANVRAARVLIDTALRLAPNDPQVLSTHAGWHLTLTGRLGTVVANLMFSASRSHGLEVFQRVLALLGDDPNTLYHFAKVRLLQSDPDALPEARQALRKLAVLHPADAWGKRCSGWRRNCWPPSKPARRALPGIPRRIEAL